MAAISAEIGRETDEAHSVCRFHIRQRMLRSRSGNRRRRSGCEARRMWVTRLSPSKYFRLFERCSNHLIQCSRLLGKQKNPARRVTLPDMEGSR
jgi:hypothetical protein